MRIVHVSDCYPPRSGGIESQVRDLARMQAARGDEVHVFTATLDSAPVADSVDVHRLGSRLAFDLPVNPGAARRMRPLLRQIQPDVVHVHAGMLSPFAFDGARVALALGLPMAITWHCMLDGILPVMRRVVRHSRWRDVPAALSAVSQVAAERVASVFEAPVDVLPNGLDLDAWRPGERPSLDGPLRCVATMRLAPRKRGPALIDAVGDACAQLEPGELTLDVIGDGPARRAVARRVRRRQLQQVVRLRGRVQRTELLAHYAGAHVFVSPAILEAFGIAGLEARSAGLAVLGHRGTGIAEYVTDGVDGLLADDDAALARALVRVAKDRDMLKRLIDHAREHPPRQGWQATLEMADRQYRRAQSLR